MDMLSSCPWQVIKSLCIGLLSLMFLMTSNAGQVQSIQGHGDDSNHYKNYNSTHTQISFLERLQGGPSSITQWDFMFLCCLLLGGFELMSYISLHIGEWVGANRIPVRGKHLDDFSMVDYFFISINKLTVVPFMYSFVKYVYEYDRPHVKWYLKDMTVINTVVAIPLLYIVYDLFYTIFHGILHIKGIYGWIHKHHHHQKAPSRGNSDAINVHPLEYILGEFNHLWAIHLVSKYVLPFIVTKTTADDNIDKDGIHVLAALLFVVIGGVLASMNHTRYDIVIFHSSIYDSKVHDVHHRIPQSNYGQYTMFWDHVFGTFRPYNPKDRINPKAQLNPETGKSIEWQHPMTTNTKESRTTTNKSD